ncbi:hypothetical protein ACTFW9_28560, partial [Klebsiella pneumoniae]
ERWIKGSAILGCVGCLVGHLFMFLVGGKTPDQSVHLNLTTTVFDLKAGYTLGLADIEILKRVARMALTAMDGEPVVFTDERNLHHIAMGRETSLIWGKQNSETGDIPLYRHAKLVPDALIQAVAFYEQVKRENPPVETGVMTPTY